MSKAQKRDNSEKWRECVDFNDAVQLNYCYMNGNEVTTNIFDNGPPTININSEIRALISSYDFFVVAAEKKGVVEDYRFTESGVQQGQTRGLFVFMLAGSDKHRKQLENDLLRSKSVYVKIEDLIGDNLQKKARHNFPIPKSKVMTSRSRSAELLCNLTTKDFGESVPIESISTMPYDFESIVRGFECDAILKADPVIFTVITRNWEGNLQPETVVYGLIAKKNPIRRFLRMTLDRLGL